MRTRTLLLLAVTCGLAILLAGGAMMWKLSNQHTSVALGKGGKGTAGDAVVVVDDFSESSGRMVVTVTLSGVDDPQGLAGFTLVGVPKPVAPLAPSGAGACTGFTVAPTTCTISFPADGFTTADRQLLFIRAEGRVRWRLV